MKKINCFKAYDIRGRLGSELNETIAYKIGRAFARVTHPQTVVLGSDSRTTSESLKLSVAQGLMDEGVDVIDIGLTGTEEIYFATSFLSVDGGIEITASHNPIDFNGMKLVGRNSIPISRSSGLTEMEQLVAEDDFDVANDKGSYIKKNLLSEYCSHILSYVDTTTFKNIKLVVNSGNGSAGHVIDHLEQLFQQRDIPVEIIKVHNEPDGTFPHGIPNPLLPECRSDTTNAVRQHKADMGIAFDGDFDRCFLFDENGDFIEGYYIVGLLADAFLQKNNGAKIIHDPRLSWNTIDVVERAGGVPVQSKTGHAFIKEAMRQHDAVYGGEMSAHHYFRDFFYCDSGMIPWLLIAELLSLKNMSLSSLVAEYIHQFPSSGEINIELDNAEKSIDSVKIFYNNLANKVELIDGLSMEFDNWRFNLRSSNTEPLVRLNVESRADKCLMESKTKEILHLLQG